MKTSSLPAQIAAESSHLLQTTRNFTEQKDIPLRKDALNAELPKKPNQEMAETAAGVMVKDNSTTLHAATADAKQQFRLNRKATDLFTALTVTETCSTKAGLNG